MDKQKVIRAALLGYGTEGSGEAGGGGSVPVYRPLGGYFE